MTLDNNSFASDENIREDHPETALAHIEASLSIDETDIDYDSTAEQFHNLVLLLQQHAQTTTEQMDVERDHGGRGILASDTVTDDAAGQAANFPQNSSDYLVGQRSRHVGFEGFGF